MNDADLYQKTNKLPKRDTILCLEEYAPKFKWKKGINNVLDIGSGDGGVTNKVLKKYIPTDFELLGSDISESMVNYANKHNSNEQTSFTVLDIEGDLPEEMKGNFDHVFSFYALHWIVDQKRAFTNIYNLLTEDGECFLLYIAASPVFEAYRVLEGNNKWKEWVQDVEKYISPYQDSKDPVNEQKKLMEKIGFVDIEAECKELEFEFDDIQYMRKAFKGVIPFNIPKDKYEEFLDDYMDALKDPQIKKKFNNIHDSILQFRYRIIVVYARKSK